MTDKPHLERRYLLVSEDGRHTTLGRDVEPDQEALDTAAEGLDGLGMAGWLVLSEGRYYSQESMALLPINCLTTRSGDWEAAAAEFHRRRAAATS